VLVLLERPKARFTLGSFYKIKVKYYSILSVRVLDLLISFSATSNKIVLVLIVYFILFYKTLFKRTFGSSFISLQKRSLKMFYSSIFFYFS